MSLSTVSDRDWRGLAARLSGRVVRPHDHDWDGMRRPQMSRFAGASPTAVVRCLTSDDVAATLAFVRAHDLPLAIRSGGHDFAGRSTTSGVVLDTSPMNHLALSGTTATVGAGARLGDVYRALAEHGRTITGGCGTTVGVAGLTLGGGLGVLGRRYGLLCDHLLAATVVLADGSVVTCDETERPELLWALRGAGHGYFGVVTELVLNTVELPRRAVFEVRWSADAFVDVLQAWQSWAPDAPRDVAASLLLTAPADPDRPMLATLFGTASEDELHLIDGFVESTGVDPDHRWHTTASWLDVKRELTDRAPGADDGAMHSRSAFHEGGLPDATVRDLVTALGDGRVAGEARELDFSPWGGAYNDRDVAATAFPHRTARFLLKHAAAVTGPDPTSPPPTGWLQESWRLAHEHSTGGVYPNFPDPELDDPATAYWQANAGRLRRLKDQCDPDGVLAPIDGVAPQA